jgi:GxxExxY protein
MNSGKGLEHEKLTEQIIGCAIEVHKGFGPGFLEAIYENAFVIELRRRNLQLEQQREVIVKYDGIEVGKHRLDLIVADTIVVELKAAKNIQDIHFAIVKSYLKVLGENMVFSSIFPSLCWRSDGSFANRFTAIRNARMQERKHAGKFPIIFS